MQISEGTVMGQNLVPGEDEKLSGFFLAIALIMKEFLLHWYPLT